MLSFFDVREADALAAAERVLREYERNKCISALINSISAEPDAMKCRKVCQGALAEADRKKFVLPAAARAMAGKAMTMSLGK